MRGTHQPKLQWDASAELLQTIGTPCRIRTCDLVLRRHPLWSTELRGLGTADYKEALLRCDLKPSTGHFVGRADRSPAPTAVSHPDQLHQSRAEFGSRDLEVVPPVI